MTLFKYIRSERIDEIENLEIRFTQPDALNDPFELHPHFESIVAEADVLANLPEAPVDLRPMVAQAYAMLPEAYRAMLPIDAAMQAVDGFMATDDARDATAQGASHARRGSPNSRSNLSSIQRQRWHTQSL
jgi:hypothetical protein